jgi:hypothetical protein
MRVADAEFGATSRAEIWCDIKSGNKGSKQNVSALFHICSTARRDPIQRSAI